MLQGSLENWEKRCPEKSSIKINFQSNYRRIVDNVQSTFNGPCRKCVFGIGIFFKFSVQLLIRLPVLRIAASDSVKKS